MNSFVKQLNRFGWIPDIPDIRDFSYRAIQPKVKIPKTIDLRQYCSAVEDQGQLGSCTAQALAANIEFLDNRLDAKYTDVSRLFIYYNERVLENSVESDSGAMLRDGIKTLKNDGACHEDIWPYVINKFALKPPVKCYAQAKKHVIVSYHRIKTIEEMVNCLASGYPFVFGFSVYKSFNSEKTAKTGIVDMPKKGEPVLGGHAVMAVGFDQLKKRFIVRNSWGVNWGINGYFTMPFKYLETLADDFWTIRK